MGIHTCNEQCSYLINEVFIIVTGIFDRAIQRFVKNKNITENKMLEDKQLRDIFRNKNITENKKSKEND
jgi:hypothetical protein